MKSIVLAATASLFLAGASFAEFRLSEFSDQYETKRRKGFTEWVTAETRDEEYKRYERKGQFPIYIESSDQGERRIYEDNPDGFLFQFWNIYGEKGFCDKDRELRKHKYVLLTASKYENAKGHVLYQGIWVSRDVEERMERVIRRYGISQAYISDDHVPEEPKARKNKKKKKE